MENLQKLTVKRRKVANVFAGEPWIYPNAIQPDQHLDPGLCIVSTETGEHIGYADYNSKAPVPGRLLSREDVWPGDEAFLEQRLIEAIERRLRLGYHFQATGFRLVNTEGDGLPGLVIDSFSTTLVIDIYSRGMRDRIPFIEAFFAEKLPGMRCAVRLGADAARREGVEQIEPEAHDITFCEQSVRFDFTIGNGQKTGFYLDQRDNRRLIAQWARNRRVLDLFCYHGAFSLSALANGAESATAIDSSEKALSAAAHNASLNGMELDTICSDVFDILPKLSEEQQSYDMIICDPPKLAPSKKDYRKALKAYRYLIERCLRLLEPNGLLLVASCSHAVGLEDMRQLLQQQSKGNTIELDVVASTNQPADHPWPVAFTNGRYLSAIMVERRN